MILGVYERFVYSLSMLTTRKRRKSLPFLFLFRTGMILGMIGLVSDSISAILYNLDTYFNTQTMVISIISFLAGVISLVVSEQM